MFAGFSEVFWERAGDVGYEGGQQEGLSEVLFYFYFILFYLFFVLFCFDLICFVLFFFGFFNLTKLSLQKKKTKTKTKKKQRIRASVRRAILLHRLFVSLCLFALIFLIVTWIFIIKT